MRSDSILGLSRRGFHRLAYRDGGGSGPTVVCAHGLTRTGRDFDRLAEALAPRWRVVCPDMPGRGASDWLADPADYAYPQYLADMTALAARLDSDGVTWIGTSMGGLIGMMLAAQPGTPIRRLVLNDVGPFIPKAALERIAGYVGRDPVFADLDGVEAHLRKVHAPFGPLCDADWRHMAEHGHRRDADGRLRLHYDPLIAHNLRAAALADVDLWAVWEQVRCPVLVLRGAESDLLLAETASRMARHGPGARVVEFAGIGHAPALMERTQIEVVAGWLAEA